MLMKYGILVLPFSSEEIVQCRRTEGRYSIFIGDLFCLICEISLTGIWTHFPSALWWLLKRSCDPVVLMAVSVVTLLIVLRWTVIGFTWSSMTQMLYSFLPFPS